MRARDKSLITEIERDALDSNASLADALRKCVVLGGQAGSSELREWAARELRGYDHREDVPEYRRPGAVLQIDAFKGNYRITEQQISPSQLPDFVAEKIGEEVPLVAGVGEIESMLMQARAKGGYLKLTMPMAADVARYMNAQVGDPFQNITAIYWSVSESALGGVLDRVRTILAELVAEMRAGMPDSEETPSAAVADQAVSVAVHGRGARVNVTSAQASGSGSHQLQARTEPSDDGSPWRRAGAAIVGIATIVGVAIAVAQWQGWSPF